MRPTARRLRLAGGLPALLLAVALSAGAQEAGTPAPLRAALETARSDAAVPLALEVDCSDAAGHRSARLYPSGVLSWNGERQARTGPAERQAVIDALLEADFASFADSYGGKPLEREAGAPVMVLCRIEAAAAGVTKSSYQDLNGERHAPFMALAERLLNALAGAGAAGVTASDFADGLAKLASGDLAAEALSLHLVRLPARRGAGVILEVAAAEVDSRSYQPGVQVGERRPRPLVRDEAEALAAALQAAGLGELPARTTAPDVYQFRVQVLQHRIAVHARPPGDDETADPAGAGLVRIADRLLEMFPPD